MRTEIVELALLLREVGQLTDLVYERDVKPDAGITRPQFFVLLNLMENNSEGMTQVKLAKFLGINPIALGRMIDRLEKDELVVRATDGSDRRAKRILLTSQGRRMMRRIFELEPIQAGPSLHGMPRPKILALNRLLRRLRDNLSIVEASPIGGEQSARRNR